MNYKIILKIHLIIFFLIILKLHAQPLRDYPAFQSVYDLGLISLQKPFFANGNSALLPGLSQFQVGININSTKNIRSLLSIAGPINHYLAFGLTWEHYNLSRIDHSPAVIQQHDEGDEFISFGFGHKIFSRLNLGHQFVLQNNHKIDQVLWDEALLGRPANLNYLEIDKIHLNYRLGFFQRISSRISLGIISPLLFQYQFIEKRAQPFISVSEKKFHFLWQEQKPQPEWAMEFEPFDNFAAMLGSGKRDSISVIHGAVKAIFFQKILIAAGMNTSSGPKFNFSYGIGGSWREFHSFVNYQPRDKQLKLSITYSPQTMPRLVELDSLIQHQQDIFGYKLKTYQNSPLISGIIENVTDAPVELRLEFTGDKFRQLNQNRNIRAYSKNHFSFNLPELKQNLTNIPGLFRLKIIAFQKERQEIEQSFTVNLYDPHYWNGELSDLLFFLPANCPKIKKLAHSIVNASNSSSGVVMIQSVCEYLNHNFHYIKDPAFVSTDYIVWPEEMLQQKYGDCEDLSLLFCSLLGALGIQTALVEVKNYQNEAHIFVLVNTELQPHHFNFLEQNQNRLILRGHLTGQKYVWLPVEVTLSGQSFEKAWEAGARIYYEYGIQQGGLANGTVKILDW